MVDWAYVCGMGDDSGNDPDLERPAVEIMDGGDTCSPMTVAVGRRVRDTSEKIDPPAPLPYVSRRALSRVKDAMPKPEACQYCGGRVELVNHAEIYGGREYGDWPYAYLCRGCGAYVGLHPHTDIPLGTLADKETREARKAVKPGFMRLVSSRFGGDRSAAYLWLACRMEIDARECHFGMFDVQRCREAMKIINQALTGRTQ